MNRTTVLLTVLTLALAWAGDTAPPTPAQRRIDALEKTLKAQGDQPRILADLAMAYARRARESANPDFYEKGMAAAKRAQQIAQGDFEAEKAVTWILLGQHEFQQAYDKARALNKRMPDDLQVYGMLVDACVELGRYKEAEEAAQWMLNLRPGAVPGLTRAAYLRELFGDLEGSLMLLDAALRTTHGNLSEDRAWIVVHMARLYRLMGKLDEAGRAAEAALRLFPEYHYALHELAEVRLAQGRAMEAATLLERRYQAAPHPENAAHLAAAQDGAGLLEEADANWKRFEQEAREEMTGWDNANRELIAYYLDRGNRPEEALRLAQFEYNRRKDVHTLGVYSRALKANGQQEKAEDIARQALSLGTRDPELLSLLK